MFKIQFMPRLQWTSAKIKKPVYKKAICGKKHLQLYRTRANDAKNSLEYNKVAYQQLPLVYATSYMLVSLVLLVVIKWTLVKEQYKIIVECEEGNIGR